MKVLNFGSLNLDYVYSVDNFLRPGETKSAMDRNTFLGGKALTSPLLWLRQEFRSITLATPVSLPRCSAGNWNSMARMSAS